MLKPSIARLANQISWSSTLNLPRSKFPPRALDAARTAYLKQCSDDLYTWQADARRGQNPFVLHDGPPYANGSLHIGHALNKILKDIICRYHISQGDLVKYKPGWDCHGLPIEVKALQASGEGHELNHASINPVEVRRRARKLAEETIEDQKKGFKAWGILGDWEHAYKTMNPSFEIRQLEVFQELVNKDLVYRDFRPVHWSPSSRTALAEAELEYDENHTSQAAYIKYELGPQFGKQLGLEAWPIYALIWTTTPWTLPANRAIAVHKTIEYCIFKFQGGAEAFLVARSRLSDVLEILGKNVSGIELLVESIRGEEICGVTGPKYLNPFAIDKQQPILAADFVSDQSGTGLVHIAPGHGFDDYKLCTEHGIEPFAPVDEQGCFTSAAFPTFPDLLHGKSIVGEGQQAILDWLVNSANPQVSLVWATHQYTHKYPIDWRTKLPVIIRATAQWFAKVDSIKGKALAALESVKFLPSTGRSRLEGFIHGRSQWCISRQRAWGVPIPALYNHNGDAVMSSASITHIIETIRERGIDAWWTDSANEPAWVAPSLANDSYTRGRDTMDVWFDSGTTWTQIPSRLPQPRADVYLEGTDQHRGWFQSSLLTYVAQQDHNADDVHSSVQPPYKTLITHGFILDAAGRKMSKSIGNVISPEQIMSGELLPPMKKKKNGYNGPTDQFDGMGPDALRLWVAMSDYTKDISISEAILKAVNGMLHKYRVTLKWLLGALADYQGPEFVDAAKPAPTPKSAIPILHISDRLALAHLVRTKSTTQAAYAAYDVNKAISSLNSYINTDLSSFYFETAKDPLYTGDAANRLRVQETCFQILQGLLQMLGPTIPLLVTEAIDHATPTLRRLLLEKQGVEKTSTASVATHPLAPSFSSDLPSHAILSTPWGPPPANVLSEAENLLKESDCLFRIHGKIRALQEAARNDRMLRSGLECTVKINATQEVCDALRSLVGHSSGWEDLAELFVVSDVEVECVGRADLHASLKQGEEAVNQRSGSGWSYRGILDPLSCGIDEPSKTVAIIDVKSPNGEKCPRCWRWVVETSRNGVEEEKVCRRCEGVMLEKGLQ